MASSSVTPDLSRVFKSPVQFIAFGFGTGLSRIMPGTVGTLAALPFYLLMSNLSVGWYLAVLAVLIGLGIWICEVAAREVGVHDYKGIVFDEVVGYLLTMAAVPFSWHWILGGFLLFRLFDIWKPWPIGFVDRKVNGGVGIVVDDLLAALYSWVCLQGLIGLKIGS